MEFVACARAAAFGLSCLDEGGEFSRGRARSPVYYERVKLSLKKVLLRTWNGSGEENVEPHTHVSTIRGLAKILGVTPKSAWKYLKLFERYSLLELCGIKFRRGELQVEGEPPLDHPLWWMPFRWRIGPALLDFFADLLRDGTEVAASPLENQYSPCVPPTSGGSLPTVQSDSVPVAQEFQNCQRDVATKTLGDREQPEASPASEPLPADFVVLTQATFGQATQSMQVQLPPEHPVHPHGRDLGYALSGCATPAVWDRVARYMGIDFRVLVRFHRRGAKIRKTEISPKEVTSVEYLQPRRERPIVPQIPRRESPAVKPASLPMPHPIGHNGPPEPEPLPEPGSGLEAALARLMACKPPS